MQITIVQAEIETAIRNYIQEQIVVREGMKIDIDLRATRGDAGFMATIDIVPVSAAKPAPVAEKPAPATARQPKVVESPVAGTIATADLPNAGATATEETASAAPAEVAEAAATEVTTETVAAPAPRTGSLFANLKKPQNT